MSLPTYSSFVLFFPFAFLYTSCWASLRFILLFLFLLLLHLVLLSLFFLLGLVNNCALYFMYFCPPYCSRISHKLHLCLSCHGSRAWHVGINCPYLSEHVLLVELYSCSLAIDINSYTVITICICIHTFFPRFYPSRRLTTGWMAATS